MTTTDLKGSGFVSRYSAPILATVATITLLVAALGHEPPRRPTASAAADPPATDDPLAAGPDSARVYPLAARFPPGQEVGIVVEAVSPTGAPVTEPVELRIFHLHEEVHRTESEAVTLRPDQPTSVEFRWTPPAIDFTGYLAVVSVRDRVIGSTGVDVSSSSLGYPRYGFLTDFSPGRSPQDIDSMVARLAQDYHQNMFQFYDWFWRHERLIQRENGEVLPEWEDLFGRSASAQTIRRQLDSVHRYNALGMAYVMNYAAREGYGELWPIEPAWGLFGSPEPINQLSLDFTAIAPERFLFLFDPANPGWQDWMTAEYVDAIETLRFDGVHIDQIGARPDVFRFDGSPLDLAAAFPPFMEATDARLTENDPERAACTFNIVDGTVGGWAVEEIARSPACDFLYSEIWFKANTYTALSRYIEHLRRIGRDRAVVLAAYPQYGDQGGPILEAEGETRLVGTGISDHELGYTGFGFVDSFDNRGDSITWSLDISEAATESLVFRYANASGRTVTANVYVNDRLSGNVLFHSRGEWSAWAADAYLQADLENGTNEVTLVLEEDTDGAVLVDHLNLSRFDADALTLQLATTYASGATSIIIGSDEQSLAHEYYPNRSKALPPALKRTLRDYFSFITAYESLLFPPEVAPIGDGFERLTATSDHRLIGEGTDGIWTVPRQIGPYDIFHLLNLSGVDEQWRNAAPRPTEQTDIGLRYHVGDAEIEGVYVAGPDHSFGQSISLPFSVGEDDRGRYIEFTVPRLLYWDMVYVRRHR